MPEDGTPSTSNPAHSKIDKLLRWFKVNGIVLSDKVRVVEAQEADNEDGRPSTGSDGTKNGTRSHTSIHDSEHLDLPLAIAAVSNVDQGEIISVIPKAAVLSRRTCSLAQRHPGAFEAFCESVYQDRVTARNGDVLVLATGLLYELHLGPSSPWWGYLESLPGSASVGLPVFWKDPEALDWLRGSDVAGWQRYYRCDKTSLSHFFKAHVKPLLDLLSPPTNNLNLQATFERAYSLVSSRAFLVDIYHGLSMVPLADIYNHLDYPHVTLQSDDIVCPVCGAFDECPHDSDVPERQDKLQKGNTSLAADETTRVLRADGLNEHDAVEMVALRPVPSGEEVFNTYGELSNAQLLTRYGFMLDSNDNDGVCWFSVRDICQQAGLPVKDAQTLEETWRRLLLSVTIHPGDDRIAHIDTEIELERSDIPRLAYIDADGSVSWPLYLLIVVAFWSNRCNANGSSAALTTNTDGIKTFAQSIDAGSVAIYLTTLCQSRIQMLRSRSVDMGDLLDLAECHPSKNTRLAILRNVQERQLLEACCSQWEEDLNVSDEGHS